MDLLLAQVVNGLLVGAFYALVALGYTIVYGVLRLINFANGATYMLGAFLGYSLLGRIGAGPFGLGIVLTIVVVGGLCGVAGILTERVAYRPLRNQPLLMMMISALGVAYVIENAVLVTPAWGSDNRLYSVRLPSGSLHAGPITIQFSQLIILAAATVLLIGLQRMVSRSIHGKAMRAVAVDRDAAQLVGVDVDRVIAATFFASASVAGITGVLAGLYFQAIHYQMGFTVGLVGFTAAVLGGIGNVAGAVVAGFLLGIAQAVALGYLGGQWQDVFVFVVLIAVLTLRPHGLLGERVGNRV